MTDTELLAEADRLAAILWRYGPLSQAAIKRAIDDLLGQITGVFVYI